MPEDNHQANGHRTRRHSRSSHTESYLRRLLKSYRFELGWLAVVAFGVFLLQERMNIRVSLARWLRTGLSVILRDIARFDDALRAFVHGLSVSDAIGYLLILVALVAIVLRLRWRLIRSPSLTTIACPRCGGEIHRVHRRLRDRIIGVLVPARRYRCSNRECRWEGLRVTSGRHHSQSASAQR